MAGAKVGLSRTLAGKANTEPWRFRAFPKTVAMPLPPTDDSWRALLPTRNPEVAVTDADGRFIITDLAPGCEVAVYANKLGCIGVWSPRVTLAAGKDTVVKTLSCRNPIARSEASW